jgi:hypothetical protein
LGAAHVQTSEARTGTDLSRRPIAADFDVGIMASRPACAKCASEAGEAADGLPTLEIWEKHEKIGPCGLPRFGRVKFMPRVRVP